MSSSFNEYYYEDGSHPDDKVLESFADIVLTIAYYLTPFQLVFSCIGFVFNLFHLLIVTRKSLRNHSIYVIMTGITICDICVILAILYYISIDFTGYFGEYDCRMPSSYSDIIVALIAGMFHDCCRRLSTWLAVLMALVRLLIIKNPLKSNMGFLSTPSFAIKTILMVFMFSFMITLLVFGQYELLDFGTYEIHYCEYLPSNYSVPYDWRLASNTVFDDIRPKLQQTILFVDGTSKIIPAVILPILSILLIRCIQKAVKSRKSLSHSRIEDSSEKLDVILVNLAVLNSIVHSIICLVISSQYRNEANKIFRCGRRRNVVSFKNNIKRKIILFEVVQAPGGNSAFSTNPRFTHSNAVVD
ncbi:hypothetical protein CRE_06418 [Caenorhabditis remanei]|uniref:G-protein coupled receptors family 1 profile domain-containing protein n=1 Tax=Caenorhabditis remanei TaxID=31234 RepID=E3M0U2_CAERE|nr:hypothetical protein CRE_06418 [Caenorhabditis remanei]